MLVAGQFVVAILLPVIAAVVFTLLLQKTRLKEASYLTWQVMVGVTYGFIAIFGTEFGIVTEDAIMNVRDAAPITAGLLFGGPAGIIAGLMGGIERWFAALWGKGVFTRVACSVSTVLAGVFAAFLNRHVFEEHRPTVRMAFSIGVVAEVVHLILVILTRLDDARRAYLIARACSIPMVLSVGVSVALAVFAVKILYHEPISTKAYKRELALIVQDGMLRGVFIALLITTGFMGVLQRSISDAQIEMLLTLNISDVHKDIMEASDERLMNIARIVARRVPSCEVGRETDLAAMADELDVTEIHIIDSKGIIIASSDESYVGFDMASGEQSAFFLELLPGGRIHELTQPYQPMTMEPHEARKFAGVTMSDGFVQVAYNAERFQGDVAKTVVSSVDHRHVGQTGFMLICDEEGLIISSETGTNARHKLSYTGIEEAIDEAKPNEVVTVEYLSIPCYAMYAFVEGYRIIALQPVDEANFSNGFTVMMNTFMVTLVFAALYSVIYGLIKHVVVDALRTVNARLSQITGGNLDVKVDVRTSEEMTSLSHDINTTVDTLKRYIDEAAARIDQELAYARDIQLAALPSVFPPYPDRDEFEIFASMHAAKEVGGDFYDFYLLDDDHLAFLVADVSGKGIPAALFMMRAKTVLKSYAASGMAVDEVLCNANSLLCEGNDADMFVTAWMGVLELSTGVVRYGNAGHNPPAVFRADGTWSYLNMRKNLLLGCFDGIPYRANELTLAPGEVLYLYTDGVNEAMNVHEVQFGTERLLASLRDHEAEDMDQLCENVRADVNDFVGEAEQFDDMTMLALRYYGPQAH